MRKVITLIRQLVEKNEDRSALEQELIALKNVIDQKETIIELQELISKKILTDSDWYNFKQKFITMYPLFFNAIKENGFELTKAEERLVSLEKLGLDTKEISIALGISANSVLTCRYRLRKRLNAPNDIPIIEFLEKVRR